MEEGRAMEGSRGEGCPCIADLHALENEPESACKTIVCKSDHSYDNKWFKLMQGKT